MSVSDYKYVKGQFVFEFDEEPIETKEAHTLVPMILTHRKYFGLCFVDCNDMTVYKSRNRYLFANGTTRVHELGPEDFLKISDVKSLLDSGATFDKTFK